MPDVRDGEKRDEYMGRCMGDDKTQAKYPNPQQRAAVCNSMYDEAQSESVNAGMEDYIFSTEEGAKKKSMEIGFKGEIHMERMADGTPMYFPAKTDEEFQRWFNKNDSHENAEAAEYQGKKVTLNKPFRTPGGPKKFAVYVQNEAGRVVIVRFGDPNMEIKRDDPNRRKNFRSRHNCDSPGPKTKARYWSCRQWESGRKVEASEEHEALGDELWFDIWSRNEGEILEGFEEVVEAEKGPCCSSCAEHAEAEEVGKDTYDNPGEAAGRAKEMGCEGIHETDGKFMPCKTHEEYMKRTDEKMAGYHKDDEKAMAGECPIGEEMVNGTCKPVNVTMEATIDSVVASVEASTGKTYMKISGIAFHEGFNKNKWAITKRGAEKTVTQMFGADLTLNHPKPKAVGFERNTDGGVNEANVGVVTEASFHDKEKEGYEVRYTASVERSELFEALESGMWLKPEYGVSIGGYGIPISANEKGMVFDKDFTFDHLAIVHKPAYPRANIEKAERMEETVEAKHGGQHGKPGPNDPRKTPAKPSERRRGSKKNPPGSAKKPNKSIVVSPATRTTIRNKMQEHNKKDKGSKASMGALLTVFRRGAGAFSTSHAPNMSRNGWGIARVNAFLYLLRNGRPSNPNYKQDNDLLPKGHPRARRTASTEETLISQTASHTEYRKENDTMSEEHIDEENAVAGEMEALQAELVLARAELEEMRAMEAAKHEEARLSLVEAASELGMKGHEDLSSETLESIIASWKESHPEPVVEMKPAEPAVASESPSPAPTSEKVVANYLNGKIVETPETLYSQAWNAWAGAWNKTLSGGETNDERIRAPKFNEL